MRSFGDGQGETGEAVWFLSDHLSSTSVTVDENGQALAARQYDPWGGVRGEKEEIDDLLTDYTYTGQRSEAALGLMYYVARWYDSGIGHFVQADTIVAGAGNPAAWNRYGYTLYNPVKYVDPSGHIPVIDDPKLRVLLSGYYQDGEPPVPDDIPEINPDNPYPNNDRPNAPHPHDPNYDDDGWEWGNWPDLGWGWRHRDDPTGTVWRPDKGYRGRKGDGEIPHWHGRRPNLPDILYPPEDIYRRGRGRGQLPLPPEDIFNPDEGIFPKPGEIPLLDPIVVIPLVPLTIIPIIILSKGGAGGITIELNECFR
jgi:RHS repeat-associated protein